MINSFTWNLSTFSAQKAVYMSLVIFGLTTNVSISIDAHLYKRKYNFNEILNRLPGSRAIGARCSQIT